MVVVDGRAVAVVGDVTGLRISEPSPRAENSSAGRAPTKNACPRRNGQAEQCCDEEGPSASHNQFTDVVIGWQ